MSVAEAATLDAGYVEATRAVLDEFDHDRSRLVPILEAIQGRFNYLPAAAVKHVACDLGVREARIFGMASFDSRFSLKPKGKHIIRFCSGKPCGSEVVADLLRAVRERLDLPDECDTTPDMLFSVETVPCLGACGIAPAMMVDDELHGQLAPEDAVAIVENLLEEALSAA